MAQADPVRARLHHRRRDVEQAGHFEVGVPGLLLPAGHPQRFHATRQRSKPIGKSGAAPPPGALVAGGQAPRVLATGSYVAARAKSLAGGEQNEKCRPPQRVTGGAGSPLRDPNSSRLEYAPKQKAPPLRRAAAPWRQGWVFSSRLASVRAYGATSAGRSRSLPR